MSSLFVVRSVAGPNRDLSKDSRDQAFWDEHAEFIDRLVDAGFIMIGGPFPDEGGAMLIVRANDVEDVRARLDPDPWYVNGLLTLAAVDRWQMFIDRRD